MIKATKKDTGNLIYMRLKKHNCPICDKQMKVIKMTKVVKAKTKEAANFNFKACDFNLGEKVKFIWYEFKCKNCNKQFTEEDMRRIEKEMKKKAAKERREAKKAAKPAEKQAKNNPQSEE
jgi:transposase-like protein